jgi:NADH-quinone oxidoreductase subunit H
MNEILQPLIALLIFPSGLFLLFAGLAYEWADRKLLAQLQNRIGPRWFQPLADVFKLLAKEEVIPDGVNPILFIGLPIIALAGGLTAALYVPVGGVPPAYSFKGDLIVALYLLSLLSLCIGLAGSNTRDRFSLLGATRTLTQLFSYEAPFLLALLGPAVVAGSWQIRDILAYANGHWLVLTQPLGFVVVLIGLMGKAAFYLGGVANPLLFLLKTVFLLLIIAGIQAILARLRIDQTVGLWWRYGTLLVLAQWLIMIGGKVIL